MQSSKIIEPDYKADFYRMSLPACHGRIHPVVFNPLTPNDLQRRREVSSLNMKIPRKDMRENTPIIHSVY
jgi:hypothetical protein